MKKEKSLFSASITTEKGDDVFTKRIILAPAWAAGILKINNLPISDITDYKKLSGLMSKEDLAVILAIQKDSRINLGKLNSIGYSDVLLSRWSESKDSEDTSLDEVIELSDKFTESELLERLDDNEKRSGVEDYQVVDIDRNKMVVLLGRKGVDTTRDPSALLELVRAILKVFYVYHKTYEVSRLPLFAWYLELLDDTKEVKPLS